MPSILSKITVLSGMLSIVSLEVFRRNSEPVAMYIRKGLSQISYVASNNIGTTAETLCGVFGLAFFSGLFIMAMDDGWNNHFERRSPSMISSAARRVRRLFRHET